MFYVNPSRRLFAAGAMLMVSAVSAFAQVNQIRLIFPFSPGAGGDGLARLIADSLKNELGEPVVVENRVGADGRIGVRAVVNAKPDGRTILLSPIAPIVLHPVVFPDLPYDPRKELAPVSLVARFEYALSAGPLSVTTNLKDTVGWLKTNRDKSAFGSPGNGGLPKYLGILLGEQAGTELRHVPYRGSLPILNDVVAGQLALGITPASDAFTLHEADKLRIVATSGDKRSPLLPDVPTFKEVGYDIAGSGWYSLYLPAGTPRDIIDRYSKVVAKAVRDPFAARSFGTVGLTLVGSTPDELAAVQEADYKRWEGLARRFQGE